VLESKKSIERGKIDDVRCGRDEKAGFFLEKKAPIVVGNVKKKLQKQQPISLLIIFLNCH